MLAIQFQHQYLLHECNDAGKVRIKDHLSGFGVGLSYGTVIMEFDMHIIFIRLFEKNGQKMQ